MKFIDIIDEIDIRAIKIKTTENPSEIRAKIAIDVIREMTGITVHSVTVHYDRKWIYDVNFNTEDDAVMFNLYV